MSVGIATRGVISGGGSGVNTVYVAHSVDPKSESIGSPILFVEDDTQPSQPDNSDANVLPNRTVQYIYAPNNNTFSLPDKM